ncbi:hypothetical protein ACWD62_43855 [Streptomyces sp. NPDC005146]
MDSTVVRTHQHAAGARNVLALTLEALMLPLPDENAACTWADPPGEASATALLVAAT